jgi:hypothetical protein
VQPLDSFPTFYGTRRSFTAFTRALHLSLPFARPIRSIPPPPPQSYLTKIHLNIIHPLMSLVFLVVSFPLAFPPISYMRSSSPFVLHALLVLLELIIIILGKEYKYEAPRYADFSTLPSPQPFSVQIFSSATCSQTPSLLSP